MEIKKKKTLQGTKITVTSDDGITVHTTDFYNNEEETLKRVQDTVNFQRNLTKAFGKQYKEDI